MSKADRRARKRQNQQLAQQERARVAQRSKRKKWIQWGAIATVAVIVVAAAVTIVGGSSSKSSTTTTTIAPDTTPTTAFVVPAGCNVTKPAKQGNGKTYKSPPPMTIDKTKTYTAKIETSCGTMVATLDAKTAPVATNNFVFLANQGFYNGLSWHRVVKDFVIQGGDPKGDGSGGPGYTVKGEVPKGAYPLGALAAAKTGSDPNGTMGSQFFVVTGTQGEQLPPQYAYWGKVTSGIDVAQKLQSFANPAVEQSTGAPYQPIYITKITISEK
jgi:cyclophilin family peptidyl-prolyl cis-trans isomerase